MLNANRTGVAKLWLLNIAGNAALMAAMYGWLVLPDSRGWQVGATAVLAILVALCGVWLRGGTFTYFRVTAFRQKPELWPVFRHAARHLIALAFWALLAAAIVWIFISSRTYSPQFGVWFRQKMPGVLRGMLSPRQVTHAADGFLWFLLWVVLPGLWLPVATTVAALGLSPASMLRSWRVLGRPLYWLGLCALLLVGVYVPYKLVWWVGFSGDLRREAWSMGLRFGAAYLIAVTGLMGIIWFAGSQTEREDESLIE